MPSTVTQEVAAFGATSHCFHGAIQLVQRRWVERHGSISSWWFIDWAWVTHSEYSHNGGYECYTDKCQCANWRISEVLSVSSANLYERLSVSWTVTLLYWQCRWLYTLSDGHAIGYSSIILTVVHFLFIEAIPLCDNISFLYIPSYTTIYIKITQLLFTI